LVKGGVWDVFGILVLHNPQEEILLVHFFMFLTKQ